jgi:hypothetical protein
MMRSELQPEPATHRLELPQYQPAPSLRTCQFWWVVASWLPGVVIFPLNLVAEAVLFLAILRRSRRAAAWHCLLSSACLVPLLTLLLTAAAYPSGRARLLGIGLMVQPDRHLDPYTRLHRGSLGCSADGSSLLILGPNHAAIYGLRYFLGPPRSAYGGPFPAREAAAAALAAGGAVTREELKGGRFTASGQAVQVSPGFDGSLSRFICRDVSAAADIRAAVFESRCLVLGVAYAGEPAEIVLVDLVSGQPFHIYHGG